MKDSKMSFTATACLSAVIFFTTFYDVANGAGGDCMNNGEIQCFECNSMEDARCHDPFNYSVYSYEMPPTQSCKGCCVKMVQFIGTEHYQIKRTCTDTFEVNFFMVNHACMTEGHRHGHMCFCEEDECNAAMPTASNNFIPAQAIGHFMMKTFSSLVPFNYVYHHVMAIGVSIWSLCLLIIYQIISSNLLSCTSTFSSKDIVRIKYLCSDEEKRRTWSCHSLDQSYKIKLSNSYNSMANTAKMDSGDISSNNKS